MSGERYGRLTVVEFDGIRNKNSYWRCACDCGQIVITQRSHLRSGTTRSCGCLRDDGNTSRARHGLHRSPTWITWMAMKQRCLNPEAADYPRYGGVGVTICERWLDFKNFLADMGERPNDRTLDRVDNDGNYEPSNCRWATASEQNQNRSSTRWIEYGGRRMCLSGWAKDLSVTKGALHGMIERHGVELTMERYSS